MNRLLLATTNPGKIAEYRALLKSVPLDMVGLREAGINLDIEEAGSTFEENALVKGRTCAQASGLLTLADDSGLCVDALSGAPGVFSARYARSDRARIERLLDEMKGVPDPQRSARFVCVIALAFPDGEALTFEGVCEGRIAHQPSGVNGFGYDPIFYLPDYGQTMAALPISIKDQISHRARAAAQARAWLIERMVSQPRKL